MLTTLILTQGRLTGRAVSIDSENFSGRKICPLIAADLSLHPSGDKIWQYSTSKIGVRVIADRGFVWSLQIADIAGWSDEWYPASELRELLTGNDAARPSERGEKIDAQKKFVEEQLAGNSRGVWFG